MQTSQVAIAATTPAVPLYLKDKELLNYFKGLGAPLPFGLVRLVQDRKNGCLGGVPYRQLGGKFVYQPNEVLRWLSGLPIIQAKPTRTIKTGRPSVGEVAEAARRGMTVKEMRGAV